MSVKEERIQMTDAKQRPITKIMHGSRKFCQRGSNFENFFLVDEWREDLNNTISEPSSARHLAYQHRPASG